MIIDLRSRNFPRAVAYDLCVVGAGAAGISIAREMAGSDVHVALIESGGFQQEPDIQELYAGTTTGDIPESDSYLKTSRLRYFGGTTNHWGGWCRPLDAIDFEEREGIPNSGWPISKRDLDPYYRRAEELVEIGSFQEIDRHQYDWSDSRLDSGEMEVRAPYFQFSPPTRFGQKYRSEILDTENIDLFLHANLTNMRLAENGKRIQKLQLEALNGNSAHLETGAAVLACGGIENPRLLLNFRDDRSRGLGNEEGLVGRYFMEHPHYNEVGRILYWDILGPSRPLADWTEFRHDEFNGVESLRVLTLSEETLRREGLLNLCIHISRKVELDSDRLNPQENRFSSAVAKFSERMLLRESTLESVLSMVKSPQPRMNTFQVRGEQVPDPRNRVTLRREKDDLGLQRVHLRSSVSDWELQNYLKTLDMMGCRFGLACQGRFNIELDETSPLRGGAHHMGTTRMSEDPSTGVVDSQCRIHDLENLYIAGSSVFPTCGFANPTLTLVALAIRLADHLKKKFDHE